MPALQNESNIKNVESEIRSDSSKYNKDTQLEQHIHEEVNTAYSHRNIIDAINDGRGRDIDDEPKKNKEPCFVLGSGPSLDRIIPFLKEWKYGIICTTSHALTLMRYGIEPTHILVLDPFCVWDEISGVDWSKTKTKLILHPSCHPSLSDNWPNEMLFYIENNGRKDSFYANTQKRMYTRREGNLRRPTFYFLIRTELTIFSCSPPAQMFVADKLGYGTIFLAGCDFGYLDGKERFTDYTVAKEPNKIYSIDKLKRDSFNILTRLMYNEDPDSVFHILKEARDSIPNIDNSSVIWEEHQHPLVEKPNDKKIFSDNGIETETIHLYYKKNMLAAWHLSRQTVYTADKGIITEIPYMDIERIIRHQDEKFEKQSWDFIHSHSEDYLSKVGLYVIYSSAGFSYVESEDPLLLLPMYINKINSEYMCDDPACGNIVGFNDTNDHVGGICPKCNHGKLTHRATSDMEENMKRIKHQVAKHHPKYLEEYQKRKDEGREFIVSIDGKLVDARTGKEVHDDGNLINDMRGKGKE